LKVLIADDSVLLRERVAGLISEIEGVELAGQVGDAQEAVEAIRRLGPDVVILDIRMPKGNGMEVLQTIKRGPLPPVVIMFTAFPYPQYRQKCLEAGADYFFDKATEFECIADLLATLQGGMEG
jgi:DNA-binding NarL/FixJ family response regulator